jgi:sulfur-oxidizing protein SoxA
MGAALQKMQDDDTANPGMLFVQLGQQLWAKPAGAANKACADCHSVADMKGVAARYPCHVQGTATSRSTSRGRIRLLPHGQPAGRAVGAGKPRSCCRSRPSSPTSRAACRSPRRPIPGWRPSASRERRSISAAKGSSIFSCAICHDDNAGKKLAGVTIPASPSDRLSALSAGVAGRGFLEAAPAQLLDRNPGRSLPYDAVEYVALEIYLMDRARGMVFESPGVRP